MAMPLFAGGNIKGIYDAINSDNVTYLTRFPKIGDKVAKQIILDLKGKLTTQTDLFQYDSRELIEVLESLGYKSNDIKKIIDKVDKYGLDQVDLEYLTSLINKFNGGPVGVETIAASIGEEVSTIEDVVEPYLLQEGFIKRTPRGRMTTDKAKEHLKEANIMFDNN